MPEMLTVGPQDADFVGGDNRALQAAVEAAAARGGGTVKVLPGVYVLGDSVHLRDNVRLVGCGPETILRKAAERGCALSADLGYGHYDISLAAPDQFEVGMGVTIRDNQAFGFYETIATLTWREGDRFGIDQMLNHDYARSRAGEVYTSFAPISARFVSKVEVRDLAIDGNRAENPHTLNGCRGGGVFLLGVRGASIANLAVRDLNGDGISFQQCTHVRIEDCLFEGNTGHGLHPGSGTVGAAMHGCRAAGNGGDGVFFCLRATYSLCDSCEFIANRGRGVSIGGRDTNNAITRCRIEGNHGAGVYLRESDRVMAPHCTLIAGNTVRGNCVERDDAEILLQAPVSDVHVLDNAVERGAGTAACGVRVCGDVAGATVFANRFAGFAQEVKVECDPGVVAAARPGAAPPVGPDSAPPGAARHLPPNVRG